MALRSDIRALQRHEFSEFDSENSIGERHPRLPLYPVGLGGDSVRVNTRGVLSETLSRFVAGVKRLSATQ